MDKTGPCQNHAILHAVDNTQVFDSLNLGIVLLAKDFTVLHWNQWMEIHSEISRKSILGRPIFALYPALDTERFRRRVRSVFKFGNYSYFSNDLHEYLIPMKNTNPAYPAFKYMQQSCSVSPVRDTANEIKSACISVSDVTDSVGSNLRLAQLMREKAEVEKQSILYSALKAFPDAVAISSADGRIIDINPGFTSLTGHSRDNIVGKSASDFGMWDPPEQRQAIVDAVKNNGFASNIICTIRTKHGELKEVLFSAITVKMAGETVMFSLAKDITSIKKADEDLLRLKKAIETIPLGITISDKSGRIIYTNPAEASMHGYAVSELVGKKANTLAPSVHHGNMEMDIIRRKEIWKRESLNIKKDDTVFPVQLTSVGVSAEDGSISSIITVCEDITERKEAENAIRQNKLRYKQLYAQFSALLDAISYPIILINKDLKIIWRNSAAAALRPNTKTIECHELLYGLDSRCQYCLASRSVASGEMESTTVVSASDRILDVKCFPILGPDGRPDSFIEILADISDQLSLQADAARVAHLAELGELAAGVAHEVNSPINCIISYAEMLQDSKPTDGELREIARRLIREGEHVARVVSNLLAYSRGSGDVIEEFSVFNIFDSTLIFVEPQLRKCGITIREDFPEQIPNITGNRHRIQQVLLNLLNNAKDALNQKYPTPHENKVIEIGCRQYLVDDRPWIGISVLDFGVGIEQDVLGRVKDAFFTLKPGGKGTGLGLSISNSIVQEHGGRLEIESEYGSYTKATIHLPLRKEEK